VRREQRRQTGRNGHCDDQPDRPTTICWATSSMFIACPIGGATDGEDLQRGQRGADVGEHERLDCRGDVVAAYRERAAVQGALAVAWAA